MQGFARIFRPANFAPNESDHEAVRPRGVESSRRASRSSTRRWRARTAWSASFSFADSALFYVCFWWAGAAEQAPADERRRPLCPDERPARRCSGRSRPRGWRNDGPSPWRSTLNPHPLLVPPPWRDGLERRGPVQGSTDIPAEFGRPGPGPAGGADPGRDRRDRHHRRLAAGPRPGHGGDRRRGARPAGGAGRRAAARSAFGEQEGKPMGDWDDDWIAGDLYAGRRRALRRPAAPRGGGGAIGRRRRPPRCWWWRMARCSARCAWPSGMSRMSGRRRPADRAASRWLMRVGMDVTPAGAGRRRRSDHHGALHIPHRARSAPGRARGS